MPRPGATSAFITAIESPYVRPAIFVQITMISGVVNVWSGVGTQLFAGGSFTGIGQFGMLSTIEEGSDVQARGIVLTLSGIDPALLGDILTDYRQGLPAQVWVGVFDAADTIQAIAAFSGQTDQPTITVSGDTATLNIACENRLVEMNTQASFRRYTNEDQQIDFPGDLGFSAVNQIQQQTLYWGRTPGNQNLGVSTGQ